MKSKQSVCSLFPTGKSTVALAKTLTAVPSGAVFAPQVTSETIAAEMEARWRISFDRSSQKRGPPAV